MKKTLFWILLSVGILGAFVVPLLFFVNNKTETQDEIGGYMPAPYESSDYSRATDSYQESPTYNNSEGSKIQKRGSINILVKNIDDMVTTLSPITNKYGGEVTDIYDSGRGNDRVLTLTIKVPVDNFETYYSELRELDGEVTFANIGTTDLTEQYIDITSRLENLREVEAQIIVILDKANTVTDILAVQKELNNVRGEIESYEAQKRYFDSQTDYSYLSLTLSIDKEGLNISDEPWKPLGEFRAALNALVSVLKTLVNSTIWILVFSPVVLIPFGIVLVINKRKK